MTTGQVECTPDRGARLARATAILLRHAIKCDEQHQWQMARVMWTKYDHAYHALVQHNTMSNLRKNTGSRLW